MVQQFQNTSTVFVTSTARSAGAELPTVVLIADGESTVKDILTSFTSSTARTIEDNITAEYRLSLIDEFSIEDIRAEVFVKDLLPVDNNITTEFVSGEYKYLQQDTRVDILLQNKNLELADVDVDLYFNTYIQDVVDDTDIEFKVTIGNIPYNNDTKVDVNFSGVKYFYLDSDIICSTATAPKSIQVDLLKESGRITKIPTDIYATTSGVVSVTSDLYNSRLYSGHDLLSDVQVSPGGFIYQYTDVYSTALGMTCIDSDIKVRSLFIRDFFIEQEEFTTADSVVWVDIVDYVYPISETNTYLQVDGVTVSGVYFKPIDNGKRLYYNPIDDFYHTGVFTYFLHAESEYGEWAEKEFYLLFGYDVQLKDRSRWQADKTVVVRMEAKNLAFCPNLESEVFYFKTVKLEAVNLYCSISPVQYIDLNAEIYPQSKAFFYGKTYKIIIKNVKDYAGNVLEDVEYEFTIESPRRK